MFSKEERETHISIDDCTDTWTLFTRQQKIMTKMRKAGVEPYRTYKDDDGRIIEAEYKLKYSQVSFRKLLSEETRKKKAEHMRKIVANRND